MRGGSGPVVVAAADAALLLLLVVEAVIEDTQAIVVEVANELVIAAVIAVAAVIVTATHALSGCGGGRRDVVELEFLFSKGGGTRTRGARHFCLQSPARAWLALAARLVQRWQRQRAACEHRGRAWRVREATQMVRIQIAGASLTRAPPRTVGFAVRSAAFCSAPGCCMSYSTVLHSSWLIDGKSARTLAGSL